MRSPFLYHQIFILLDTTHNRKFLPIFMLLLHFYLQIANIYFEQARDSTAIAIHFDNFMETNLCIDCDSENKIHHK